METRYTPSQNGQGFQQQDAASIGDNAALADDRVLWELLRLLPGSATPQKAILPFGQSGQKEYNGLGSTALVFGNASDGKVRVMPFRAIVAGTITTIGVENLRGIRSGYLVGGTTFETKISLGANASGNPRWDLLYARITPDADGDSVQRFKKDPTTEVVSQVTVVLNKKTTVTVNVQQGVPNASPVRPAAPADAGGIYNIPLAYVWVPNGFTSASAVLREYIHEHAACIPIHAALGVVPMAPANQQHKAGGVVDTNQSGSSSATRPGAYLPSTMVGGEKRFILVQNGFPPVSHADGDVVDDSVDWRFRYFRFTVAVKAGNTSIAAFPSDRALSSNVPPHAASNQQLGTFTFHGVGQSFVADGAALGINPADSAGAALYVTDSDVSQLGGATKLLLYVRNTDGALVLKKSGAGTYQAAIWLEATAPYSNYGVV